MPLLQGILLRSKLLMQRGTGFTICPSFWSLSNQQKNKNKSGINKIYVMTQFNSTSLNRHLARTYNVGSGVRFGGDGFVEVLAATQTPTDKEWFQGTADAVRQYAWLFSDTKVRPRGMGGERDAHGENAAAGGEA